MRRGGGGERFENFESFEIHNGSGKPEAACRFVLNGQLKVGRGLW